MFDTRVLTVNVCKLVNPLDKHHRSFQKLHQWRPEFEIEDSSKEVIQEAAELLKNEHVVAFPTETVYGLGGNGLNEKSVSKIFAAKGRPSDNPLILHISNLEMLSMILPKGHKLPHIYEDLISMYWPGPLSIIVPRGDQVPLISTGNLDTVAVRFPSHPVALALIEACGFPLAAPSANESGKPSTTQASHVIEDLRGRIPLVIDGGPCFNGLESTVVNALSSNPPLILRPGSLSLEDIKGAKGLENIMVAPNLESDSSIPQAPGMKYRHYSPKAKLILLAPESPTSYIWGKWSPLEAIRDEVSALVKDNPEVKVGILTLTSDQNTVRAYGNLAPGKTHVISLYDRGQNGTLSNAARALFASLREFDDRRMDYIIAEAVPETQCGLAIMNRLKKAATLIKHI